MKLPLRRPAVVVAATMAALVVALPSTALARPHAKEYSLAQYAVPADITTGPDGALWAPDGSLGRLWRVTTKGKVSSIEVGGGPAGVATGPDGALWVADRDDRILRVTTRGQITAYPLPHRESGEDSFPTSIVAGPDGALWFTEAHGDRIGRITTSGDLSEYPLETTDAFAANITVGPDRALWFTESSGNKVGRITTSDKKLTEFPLEPDSNPGAIVARDGALYFTEANTDVVARMNTAGQVTRRYPLPTGALPLGLASTRHGLYVAEHMASAIVGLNPWAGFGREVRVKSAPDAVTVGPDGALWYASGNEAKIGRLEIDR